MPPDFYFVLTLIAKMAITAVIRRRGDDHG